MSVADVPALEEWMPDSSIYTYWGKGPSKGEKNPQLLFEKEEKPTKSLQKANEVQIPPPLCFSDYFAQII